jgi:hypothetical protein
MEALRKQAYTSAVPLSESDPVNWGKRPEGTNGQHDPYIWKTTEIVIEES